jgi:hypothetical protein
MSARAALSTRRCRTSARLGSNARACCCRSAATGGPRRAARQATAGATAPTSPPERETVGATAAWPRWVAARAQGWTAHPSWPAQGRIKARPSGRRSHAPRGLPGDGGGGRPKADDPAAQGRGGLGLRSRPGGPGSARASGSPREARGGPLPARRPGSPVRGSAPTCGWVPGATAGQGRHAGPSPGFVKPFGQRLTPPSCEGRPGPRARRREVPPGGLPARTESGARGWSPRHPAGRRPPAPAWRWRCSCAAPSTPRRRRS